MSSNQKPVSDNSVKPIYYFERVMYILFVYNDACSINDDNEFENSYKDIYSKDLHLKCDYTGSHATIKDSVIYL